MRDKIVITGAGGFIGSHLVEHLLSDGAKKSNLRLILSPNETTKNLPSVPLNIIRADIRQKAPLKKALEGANIVYHLAAVSGYGGNKYSDYASVNVGGTQNLIDACIGQPIRKFIFFSSIAVYGLTPGIGDIKGWDENHKKTYTEIYGKSKFEAEKRIIIASKKANLPHSIIRPTSVYGPRDLGQLFQLFQVIKHRRFIMLGNGKNLMHYVYVKDLVKGACLAAKSKEYGSDYILGGKEPTPFKQVVENISSTIHTSIPNFYIPKPLVLPISHISQIAGNLIHKPSPLFPTRAKIMTSTYYYSIDKARQQLKYNPSVTFSKGCSITGKWYLQNHLLA